ncbi:MAG: DPP IV N-terminal domain-containing protein [Acidobacteria bacterium]|nr:DPP IV N-terminal domain-containing protein [Acidobacteriota bacterium]
MRGKLQGLAVNVPSSVTAIENTNRFWYRKSVKGGNEFVVVDAATLVKRPAFDHARLAETLSTAIGQKLTLITLPFQTITFVDNETAIEFAAAGSVWKCDLSSYQCTKVRPAPAGQRGRGGPEFDEFEEFSGGFNNLTLEPAPEVLEPPVFSVQGQRGQRGGQRGLPQQPQIPQIQAQQYRGEGQIGFGTGANLLRPVGQAAEPPPVEPPKESPDGKWEAYVNNYNVFLRAKGETQGNPLSFDGSEGNYYTLRSISWSPDSKYLAAYRVRPGYHRKIVYVQSSPPDQVHPKYLQREYPKPGDAVDLPQPVLFEVAIRKQTIIDNTLFSNPYHLTEFIWWKDSRAFTFEYNQRGHQIYRVIEVDAAMGKPRAILTEEAKTFFTYTSKRYRFDTADGKEMIWMSERDGWNHLYVNDNATGKVKNQITKGEWVVRGVDKVDEEARQIWFRASGMYPGKDPYFVHYYRINFDGAGLTTFTEADGNHSVTFTSDMKYYVDTWSRVNMAPAAQLRRTPDQTILMDVEKGDISELVQAGWRAPEFFVSKARDGKTDIWGIINRPTNFDPSRKYPVIEYIYAGPQGSFVPKTFGGFSTMQALAELGFIVVQMDGMGTNNRSKAFHDYAFRNIGDAGFPDRILWHKAVAAKYPYYDISRVGIYGTSAGGQNSTGALLFHPEFYKVAVSNSGCHDNRMDKISWNEQWMSWPIGPEYGQSSNVDNAHKLQGKLLLILPELDTNVDPASTMQVANALLKANKKFDMLVVPGADHGAGGITQHYLQDFFVHHLLGVEPPDWNRIQTGQAASSSAGRNQN